MSLTRLPDHLRVSLDKVAAPRPVKDTLHAWVADFKHYRRTAGVEIDPDKYGRGLLLTGSHRDVNVRLAGAVAYQCRLDHFAVPAFVEIERWVNLNKLLWDRSSNTEGDLMEASAALSRCHRAELLVIDGLGRERANDWTQGEIPALVAERKLRGRPTIVTTQLNPRSLLAQYTESTVFASALIPVGVVEAGMKG